MKKTFNTTGGCFSDIHYMMDMSKKLAVLMEYIELGKYVTINRPRQYGKTTTLYALVEQLHHTDTYLPIKVSFEDVRDVAHVSDDAFAQMFLQKLQKVFKRLDATINNLIKAINPAIFTLTDLSDMITDMAYATDKKLVLLIDEVDASSNYASFLKFLAMLRAKYLNRRMPEDKTFHSIILAGVHDVKSLKYKLNHLQHAQYNSPWNIAVDFRKTMSFSPTEIASMLLQYKTAENITMEIETIAAKLYYYTAGYPFLVSRLCEIVAKDILPTKSNTKQWTIDDIERAVQQILLENNTNFDSLFKNIRNHQDLYDLAFHILIDGYEISFDPYNSVISKGILYGVFKRNGQIKIHNRIYEQLVYNYMVSKIEIDRTKVLKYNTNSQFYLPNQGLDVEKILLKFQTFMKSEYNDKDQPFLEREWRLIFLAFIRPIINGSGYTFKEVQISQEKRLDVVITFFQHQYIVELKRWNGQKVHQEGILQLHDYLNRQKQTKGFLVIFEYRTQKTWRKEWIKKDGKEIFAIWI